MSTIKLTVTISKEVFTKIEEERRSKKIPRSVFVNSILKKYFEEQSKKELIKKYIDGYKNIPEKPNELKALSEVQSSVLGDF